MISIVYLVYKKDYDFFCDLEFVRWLEKLNNVHPIGHIRIIDNYNLGEPDKVFAWDGIKVVKQSGDNAQREFSGYRKGLAAEPTGDAVLVLNDTFLQAKHAPNALLLPALVQAIPFLRTARNAVFGELNRPPVGATFCNKSGLTWLSTYCLLTATENVGCLIRAIDAAVLIYEKGESSFNGRFVSHIDKQIRSAPSACDVSWRLRKIRATAAEIALSHELRMRYLRLISIYSPVVSKMLYIQHTKRRVLRKLVFMFGVLSWNFGE